jgi:hypothetical protein
MSKSDFLENELLDHVFNADYTAPAAVHVSLHTADPGETGADEVTGGSYARQSVTRGTGWNDATGGLVDNAAAIQFTDMPAVTVTHAGIWDAATDGNFLYGGALAASKVVNAGDTFEFPAGDLDITED